MSQEVGRDLGVPVMSQKAGATWRGIKHELIPWGTTTDEQHSDDVRMFRRDLIALPLGTLSFFGHMLLKSKLIACTLPPFGRAWLILGLHNCLSTETCFAPHLTLLYLNKTKDVNMSILKTVVTEGVFNTTANNPGTATLSGIQSWGWLKYVKSVVEWRTATTNKKYYNLQFPFGRHFYQKRRKHEIFIQEI